MRRLMFLILSATLLWVTASSEALDIELTQGIGAAIPIAITPFGNEQQSLVPGQQTFSEVMHNDLQNSGQFRVNTPSGQQPTNISQVDFNFWRKQSVNDLVVGNIHAVGGNRYEVSFQLIDLFANNHSGGPINPSQSVLISNSFTVPASALRQAAHRVSDMIYQKLTGARGVFSTKIAYVVVQHDANQRGKYSLEVSDQDGFNPQALMVSGQPIMSPTWAPDGRKIAYVSFEQGTPGIYLQDLYRGSRQLISDYPGVNGAPSFSPDGRKIALVLTRTDNPKIYIMGISGRGLTQVTNGYSIDTEPSWSPDGQSLLFTSNTGGTPQIYRYNLASGQTQRVTFDGNYNARPSFFPDGQNIILMHRSSGDYNQFGIARENLQTGGLQVLVQTGNDESPSLAPNGKMVIYSTLYDGRGVLAMVSTDGRIKLRLPAREGDVQDPAWSPFL